MESFKAFSPLIQLYSFISQYPDNDSIQLKLKREKVKINNNKNNNKKPQQLFRWQFKGVADRPLLDEDTCLRNIPPDAKLPSPTPSLK